MNIFAKDVKAFFRDIRSFSLLFLTPVMLVLIIGVSFLNVAPSNVKIAICSVESNEVDSYLQNALKDNTIFLVEKIQMESVMECRRVVREKILYSSYRAGVIVPQKSEYQTKIELVVDNSKLVSEYIKSYFQLLTNDLSQRITKGYVDLLFTNIDEVRNNIDDLQNTLTEEKTQMNSIKQDLSSLRNSLLSAKTTIQSSGDSLISVTNSIDGSLSSIDTAQTRMTNSAQSIGTALLFLNMANISDSERTPIRNELANTQASLQAGSSSLSLLRSDLTGIRSRITGARTQINSVYIDSMVTSVDGLTSSVDSSMSKIDYVLGRLALLKRMVQDANITKPQTVQFVGAEIKDFFSNKFIDFLFPATVLMVIMVLSIFLASITFIRQRSSGLIHRVAIAPNGLRLVITERLVMIAFLSLIALPIIFCAGVFVLHTNLTFVNLGVLILTAIITAIIFASLGLIIASLSKYESTAILLAIFIALPMIFLSGILLPMEKLPAEISSVANNLPLNIAIRLFESLSFYSVDAGTLLGYIGSLAAYFLAGILIAWILIKREIKG
jgi:ABC-type multidrug transport system permease subunit